MTARAHDSRDPHQIELLQGSQEYFPALVAAMDHARSEVRLETYIFDFTGEAVEVAEALVRAATRGVTTWVVVDGVGTDALPPLWRKRFETAGVQWSVYAPLGTLGLLIPSRWRRLHRKLCVIDGRLAFCGGINILDDFHDPHHGRLNEPRLDFAVRASGALVLQAQETTAQLWWRMQGVRDMRAHHFPHAFKNVALGRSGPALEAASSGTGPTGRHARRRVPRWCCATTCSTAAASSVRTAAPSPMRRRRSSSRTPTSCLGGGSGAP
jgi:cardiolipin synthase